MLTGGSFDPASTSELSSRGSALGDRVRLLVVVVATLLPVVCLFFCAFVFFAAGSPVGGWLGEGRQPCAIVSSDSARKDARFQLPAETDAVLKMFGRRQTWGRLPCCTCTLCDVTKGQFIFQNCGFVARALLRSGQKQ